MTQLIPYLNFDGNCRQAMTFYQDCLGGELALQTVGESPVASHFPSEMASAIIHATLANGAVNLTGSDMVGAALSPGNSVTLMLNCSSEEEINTVFAKLADGGIVGDVLQDGFWGATFGTVSDKFGISWMLHFDKNQPQ
jgi:PhnB protein